MLAGGSAMLTRAVQTYLSVRRATGFALEKQGCRLRSFAAYSDAKGEHYVTSQTAIEWARQTSSVEARARRLGDVIRLARYLRAEDERHEIPMAVFGSGRHRRRSPYIYSDDQIRQLIQLTAQSGRRSLHRQTYSTLFALLSCTGLRVSEATRLRYDDITPDGLVIRATKFQKSRLVPLHETARAGLERYLKRRRPYAPLDDHVFVSIKRRQLRVQSVEAAFRTVADKMHWPRGSRQRRPTLHSLRHTFAVRALQACSDRRDHITQHMLMLSTYLGHCRVADTYWYLEAVPSLMRGIADHTEAYVLGGTP
jgi:integrase/recombinase XerD